jgi:glucose-1-phosphate adenylyltransferase
MDYKRMLDHHKAQKADVTIAVIEVPWEEASRFGIMATDDAGVITEFAEKPAEPKSNLASMGVYIYSWAKLKKYLIANENDKEAKKDFGGNIIPDMLKDGCKMVAYNFDSYWKDVGTIDSLWEANMDLLNPKVPLDLYDPQWRIYSRNEAMPPHYCGDNCTIENSMISEGCNIDGLVDSSILFGGVTIEKGAVVHDSIIMPNSCIKSGAIVQYAIVGEDTVINENVRIGERPELMENKDDWGVAVVGHGVEVSANAEVKPKAMISENI